MLVDAHDEHGRVGRGGRDHHLLRAALEVLAGLGHVNEHTRRLHNVLGTVGAPRDLGGVLAGVGVNAWESR